MFRRTLTLAQGTPELPRFGGHLTLGISPARSWLILSDSFPEVLAKLGPVGGRPAVLKDGLEAARERQEDLKEQIERCQNLLEGSRSWVGFESESFRDALSCSLELMGAALLTETKDEHGKPAWSFPPLDRRAETDASWAATLDTLRSPRATNQKLTDWRREAPILPVVFEDAGVLSEDTVHLHLEQRVAQRLLARFRSQGFIHHDLSRACLAQAADSIPRVILLGRLSLYGRRAERLHEELVPLAARWIEPTRRQGPLKAYAREAEAKTLDLLEQSLSTPLPAKPRMSTTPKRPGPPDPREARPGAGGRVTSAGRPGRGGLP